VPFIGLLLAMLICFRKPLNKINGFDKHCVPVEMGVQCATNNIVFVEIALLQNSYIIDVKPV
jgi:hypothetical protein